MLISRKQAIWKADEAFGRYIRLRDRRCVFKGLDDIVCGGLLECMHLITRQNFRLRYDDKNALTGCHDHHLYYTGHPEAWDRLLRKEFYDLWLYTKHEKILPQPNYTTSQILAIEEKYREWSSQLWRVIYGKRYKRK